MAKIITSCLDDSENQSKAGEADKLQLVRSRFEQINELDLRDGLRFFEELDSGIYD